MSKHVTPSAVRRSRLLRPHPESKWPVSAALGECIRIASVSHPFREEIRTGNTMSYLAELLESIYVGTTNLRVTDLRTTKKRITLDSKKRNRR